MLFRKSAKFTFITHFFFKFNLNLRKTKKIRKSNTFPKRTPVGFTGRIWSVGKGFVKFQIQQKIKEFISIN